MLSNFKWYRRKSGGMWSQVIGRLWGKRWVKLPAEAIEKSDEYWGFPGQTTFCYCPGCRRELCEQHAELTHVGILDRGSQRYLVKYRCWCGKRTVWDFDAPVPILLER